MRAFFAGLCLASVVQAQEWRVERVDTGEPLNGVAIGDFSQEHPGQEIVAVGREGHVFMVWRRPTGLRSLGIGATTGEGMQVAIGDAEPARRGDEIAIVGPASGHEGDGEGGYLTVLAGARIPLSDVSLPFEDRALLHAVCIADGGVYVAGSSRKVHFVRRDGDEWRAEQVGELPAQGRNAVRTRAGVVFTCRDGSLVLVRRDGPTELLEKRDVGRARLAAHEDLLLVADDDGALRLLANGAWTEAYRSPLPLRGAVIADIDPRVDGPELATAGYAGEVVVLRRDGERWTPQVVAKDDARIHHLAYGDDVGEWGRALAAASLGGEIIIAIPPR